MRANPKAARQKPKDQVLFLLNLRNMKATPMRVHLLTYFLQNMGKAVNLKTISNFLKKKQETPIDRVTLYRNLKLFEKMGFIHSMSNGLYTGCHFIDLATPCSLPHWLIECSSCHRVCEVGPFQDAHFHIWLETKGFAPKKVEKLTAMCQKCVLKRSTKNPS